jgi:hypothetical protein
MKTWLYGTPCMYIKVQQNLGLEGGWRAQMKTLLIMRCITQYPGLSLSWEWGPPDLYHIAEESFLIPVLT